MSHYHPAEDSVRDERPISDREARVHYTRVGLVTGLAIGTLFGMFLMLAAVGTKVAITGAV